LGRGAIAGLPTGIPKSRVEAQLGTAESIYEIWEGSDERVTVLRYGLWELTFVDGQLEQKAR
jgi:hypothetical protein